MDTCEVDGCSRRVGVKKRGLCTGHNLQRHQGKPFTYLPPQEGRDPCPVKDCDKLQSSRGLCVAHSSVCWRMSIDPRDYAALCYGPCDVCGTVSKLMVEHDHDCCEGNYSCGVCVRGWVCRTCNSLIGFLERKIDRSDNSVHRATEFLEKPPGSRARIFKIKSSKDSHPGRNR